MDLILTILVFLIALVFCLIKGFSLAWALFLTFLLLFVCGLRRKHSVKELLQMVRKEIPSVLIVVRILCYVGLLTGLWRGCGTIAFFIWHGIRIVPPSLFLVLTFLLSALLSYAIGTSFGVTSTVGVMLISLARAGGVPVPVTAGVILSGVYFGDRGAPTSSCAALVSAITKTDHYSNVRFMLKTATLPFMLTLAVSVFFSIRNPIVTVDQSLLAEIASQYSISFLLLIPAIIMLLLPLFKVPIRICMIGSALAAFILMIAVQGSSVGKALLVAVCGYSLDGPLSSVLSGGGLLSMVPTILLILFAGSCTGIINGLHLLNPLQDRFAIISKKLGRYPATCIAGIISLMVFCNQTIATMFCNEVMQEVYRSEGASLEELSSDISSSVVIIAGLIPWAISCSVPLTMLNAGYDAIPYSCFLYLLPICYFLTKKMFFRSKDSRPSVSQNHN